MTDHRGNNGPPIGGTDRIEETLANLALWILALPVDDAILAADAADALMMLDSALSDMRDYETRYRQLAAGQVERLTMEGGG